MKTEIQYRLRANVDIYETDQGCVLVSLVDGKTLSLGADTADMVNRLQGDWMTEDNAVEKAEDLSRAYFALIQMQKSGMMDARLVKGDMTLFSLSPSPEDSAFKGHFERGVTYRLNQYAFLRGEGGCLLLESPLTPSRVAVEDGKLAGMLHQLCSGLRLDVAGEDTGCFLSILIALGMVEPDTKKNEDDPMDFWQFHDLLFYRRTLNGRHVYPLGGTYRFQGKRPSLPPIRDPISDEILELPEPSENLTERLNAPFSKVLGNRASKREFSNGSMALEDLGTFLYTTAKVKEVVADPQHDDEITMRPSPAGGARHPLEIYPLVRRCEGMDPGAYRYDATNHLLEKVAADKAGLERLLEENPYEFLGVVSPQVTLNISARIGRTAWKYDSIAYKIINQDLGCLYQTFYLVATALGLSPCALGSVETEQLGKVMGIDWREEPFIGAFTLGK
ncbi:SagB family peptide dehydrogenase [Thermodesulfobacteriota bacterium]